jgi:hypothetical protein
MLWYMAGMMIGFVLGVLAGGEPGSEEDYIKQLEAENASLKAMLPKKMLFDEIFMERFHIYARHKHGCTYDQLDKGDICTCGLQALINQYYEIQDALLTQQEQDDG